ncbi:hypothetical protein HZH68_015469 [Vespula germanica]|uniref:Uncharacterized protein n=1 Tax=Vespula germanica TaxID=30212 RepID=A0A834MS48_VESGE|nr:hypothetical protein HZH68_015469 [Vespula germanica]
MIRKVYGDDSMSDTRIKELFRRFRSGPRSGRLIMVKTPENVKRSRFRNESRSCKIRSTVAERRPKELLGGCHLEQFRINQKQARNVEKGQNSWE